MNTNDQLEPTVFVIFGGGGDLTWRKLVPALFDLSQDRSMPAKFSIIGVDRVKMGDESVVATGIHRFWKAGGGWVMARELKPGDPIRTLDWPAVQSRAPEVLRLEQLIGALAASGMGAHVDVKFETSGSARKSGESWEADLLAGLDLAGPVRR